MFVIVINAPPGLKNNRLSSYKCSRQRVENQYYN
nr:MAG TPA: hypothetical protein [Caudoviricetes sp.]